MCHNDVEYCYVFSILMHVTYEEGYVNDNTYIRNFLEN